jgi:crossover junction endodeoxyribonuclease RuvC
MVTRLLGLEVAPKPADAADALAIAICHAWRSGPVAAAGSADLTPAQQAWRKAEAATRRP